MRKIFIAMILVLTLNVSARAADLYRDYQPISKSEMVRKTLEEEELEMTLAEERAAAKFYRAYRADINELVKPRANKVQDRVTFIINEKTDTKIEAKNELKSENDTSMTINKWFQLKDMKRLIPGIGNYDDKEIAAANAAAAPNKLLEYEADTEHNGEGKTNRTGTFTTKLSGNVVEVLPNGHLVVEARKEIRVNEEMQEVLFTGVVDPADLNENSEVQGERVMNLRIAMKGNGEVNDTIRQGWAARIYSKIKPF